MSELDLSKYDYEAARLAESEALAKELAANTARQFDSRAQLATEMGNARIANVDKDIQGLDKKYAAAIAGEDAFHSYFDHIKDPTVKKHMMDLFGNKIHDTLLKFTEHPGVFNKAADQELAGLIADPKMIKMLQTIAGLETAQDTYRTNYTTHNPYSEDSKYSDPNLISPDKLDMSHLFNKEGTDIDQSQLLELQKHFNMDFKELPYAKIHSVQDFVDSVVASFQPGLLNNQRTLSEVRDMIEGAISGNGVMGGVAGLDERTLQHVRHIIETDYMAAHKGERPDEHYVTQEMTNVAHKIERILQKEDTQQLGQVVTGGHKGDKNANVSKQPTTIERLYTTILQQLREVNHTLSGIGGGKIPLGIEVLNQLYGKGANTVGIDLSTTILLPNALSKKLEALSKDIPGLRHNFYNMIQNYAEIIPNTYHTGAVQGRHGISLVTWVKVRVEVKDLAGVDTVVHKNIIAKNDTLVKDPKNFVKSVKNNAFTTDGKYYYIDVKLDRNTRLSVAEMDLKKDGEGAPGKGEINTFPGNVLKTKINNQPG